MQGEIESDGVNQTLILTAETMREASQLTHWRYMVEGGGVDLETDSDNVRLLIQLRQRAAKQSAKKGKTEPEAAQESRSSSEMFGEANAQAS